MVIIFIENNYILFRNIKNIIKKTLFIYLSMIKREKKIIKMIILIIYKDNI